MERRPTMPTPRLRVSGLAKAFTMHLRGGLRLPVVSGIDFTVGAGSCLALSGPSGAGKSSILKMIYGTYRIDSGAVLVGDGVQTVDVATADPHTILDLRRRTIGYVSQFLRVIPRVSALDVVAEPALALGVPHGEARARAGALLDRLGVPERLWDLPPATFSGGEQQRINVARGFVADRPILLLDEPTASLDARNRDVVCDLILEKRKAGVALVGIFHDAAVRERVADVVIEVDRPPSAQAA